MLNTIERVEGTEKVERQSQEFEKQFSKYLKAMLTKRFMFIDYQVNCIEEETDEDNNNNIIMYIDCKFQNEEYELKVTEVETGYWSTFTVEKKNPGTSDFYYMTEWEHCFR